MQDSFALRQEIRKRDGELATVGVVTLVKIDLSTRTVPGELTAPLSNVTLVGNGELSPADLTPRSNEIASRCMPTDHVKPLEERL